MKLFKKLSVLGVSALMLAACSGTYDLEGVRNMKSTGSIFQKGLHAEYAQLAADEAAESDWADAGTFNTRAMMAAQGKSFGPENMSDRNIPADKVGELSTARARLMRALDAGGANSKPGPASRAQAMFDCWMQEQEENFQPEDIARCRAAFEAAMKELEAKPAMAKPAPKPMMKMPNKGPYVILFDFNKSNLNKAANEVIAQIVAASKSYSGAKLEVTAHTDRSGDAGYNAGLAEARGKAVAAALKGKVSNPIQVLNFGEWRNWIATDDGVKQQLNRRVEVRIK